MSPLMISWPLLSKMLKELKPFVRERRTFPPLKWMKFFKRSSSETSMTLRKDCILWCPGMLLSCMGIEASKLYSLAICKSLAIMVSFLCFKKWFDSFFLSASLSIATLLDSSKMGHRLEPRVFEKDCAQFSAYSTWFWTARHPHHSWIFWVSCRRRRRKRDCSSLNHSDLKTRSKARTCTSASHIGYTHLEIRKDLTS